MSFFSKQPGRQPQHLNAEIIATIDKLYITARMTATDAAELLRKTGASEESILVAALIYRDYVEPFRDRGIDPALHFKSTIENTKEMRMVDKIPSVKSKCKKINEGMRRLGIVTGIILVLSWVIFAAILTDGFKEVHDLGWLIFFFGIPFFFAFGRLLLWAIDWVISGFRQDI